MAARDPARRRRIAQAGAAAKHHSPDAGRRRAEVAAEALEQHIKRIVDASVPLSAQQRDRLAALLRPTTDPTEQQKEAS